MPSILTSAVYLPPVPVVLCTPFKPVALLDDSSNSNPSATAAALTSAAVCGWGPSFTPRFRRLCRSSRQTDVPSEMQGRPFRRSKAAEVVLLATLPATVYLVLATALEHTLEARRVARRRHQLEALGHRGSPDLGEIQWLLKHL